MTDRREFTANDRRGKAGKVFQTTEQILQKKQEATDKLNQYEEEKGVGVKKFLVYTVAIVGIIGAYLGMHFDRNIFLWMGIATTVAVVTLGEMWIRSAKKKAREEFEKDPNRHLMKHLPS